MLSMRHFRQATICEPGLVGIVNRSERCAMPLPIPEPSSEVPSTNTHDTVMYKQPIDTQEQARGDARYKAAFESCLTVLTSTAIILSLL